MLTQQTDNSVYGRKTADINKVSFVWIYDRSEEDVDGTLRSYVAAIQATPYATDLTVINNGRGSRFSHRIAEHMRGTGIDTSVINFNTKCSETTALSVAFRHVDGDVIALLPAYPQSDPKDISRMLDAVHDGLDYVASWRTPRIDSKREQRKSKVFNSITRWLSGIPLHDINSGMRVLRREVVEELPLYGDLHIYIPILAARLGFTIGEIPVRHLEERPGEAAQGLSVYLRRALDLLTLFFLIRFTQKPFRFFGGIGTAMIGLGGIINLVLAVQRVLWRQSLADRPMLIFAMLLMVLGVQMFSLGLIGELIIFVSAGGIADYQVEDVFETAIEDEELIGDNQHRTS